MSAGGGQVGGPGANRVAFFALLFLNRYGQTKNLGFICKDYHNRSAMKKTKSMLKYLNTSITFLITLLCSSNLVAQEKFEKESRIKRQDVPSNAVQFIDSLVLKNRVKWFLEEGLERKSIEAKFKNKKKRYSIEFDTLGNVEDVEIEINWKELRTQLKDSIYFRLKKDCLKHKIVKVQIQFSGNQPDLLSKLKTTETIPNLITKYEVIVKCSSKNSVDLFEYLFSDAGQPLSISKIIFKNSSHLEY